MSPIARPLAVAFDCHDPATLLKFWQQLVGGVPEPGPHEDDFLVLEDVPVFGYLGFQKVPEGKTAKNRVHLDIEVDSIDVAAVAAVRAGARMQGGTVAESTGWFQVMLDPEGNEFCLIRRG
ncbi:MAG: VOC family protein [Actinomycetota bacterium]